jgi:hypothetical protein
MPSRVPRVPGQALAAGATAALLSLTPFHGRFGDAFGVWRFPF